MLAGIPVSQVPWLHRWRGLLRDTAARWTKGTTTVHADVLGDNPFILDALRRIGPLRWRLSSEAIQLTSTYAAIGVSPQ
jgi:hypothetical protein